MATRMNIAYQAAIKDAEFVIEMIKDAESNRKYLYGDADDLHAGIVVAAYTGWCLARLGVDKCKELPWW